MKKKLLLCLIAANVLAGCGETPSNPSNENPSLPSGITSETSNSIRDSISMEEPIEYYATINSKYDVVNIYGVVGETFDLKTIDTSRCVTNKVDNYKCSSEGISFNKNLLTFDKAGLYTVEAYEGKIKIYSLQITVNENEDSRYAYPFDIDLTNYKQYSGEKDLVTIDNNVITLQSTNSYNRIIYQLDDRFDKNYTIECDASFINATESSRWLGFIFYNQEDNETQKSYYQFDIRQNANLSNSVEVTNFYNVTNSGYSYPYSGSWGEANPGLLDETKPVHMKIQIQDSKFIGTLSCGNYTKEVTATLSNTNGGNFGFQCSGATVKFENIKIYLDENNKIQSTANSADSIVNIEDDLFDTLKPNIISSGNTLDELYGVCENSQHFFVKVKNNKLYSLTDVEMDINLNDLILELRGLYIPNIQIEDEETLNYVATVCKSYAIKDLIIWSTNTDILDKAREVYASARLGYIPTNLTSFETYDEIGGVCREAGKHYTNLVMIDSELLNKENVNKAQGIGYSIVANAKSGANYSVIDSALSGCKLIVANFTKNVLQQTTMIYDDDVFTVNEKSSTISNQTHSLFSFPYATGHRGAGTNGSNPAVSLPENTIESFKWAYDHGAQAVEIDIHKTIDNKLAVVHNATTGEYSNKDLTVASSSLSTLQALPLRVNGTLSTEYKIPSMEEVLDAFSGDEYKGKSMVVEVKDNKFETGKMAIELAKQKGWYNRITLITFSDATAKKLREYDPGVQCSFLGTVYRNDNTQYWDSVNSYLSNGVGLASQWSTITTEAMQESNARGDIYWLWTFDIGHTTQLIEQIFNGNIGFTTNYISFFDNNKYKLTIDNSITLAANETKNIVAKSTTYSKTVTDENDIEIIVLSDNATANGNSLTRTADGDIYIVAKKTVVWTLGSTTTKFCIYSDVVTIK